MARDDALDEGRARARHPEDEHRCLVTLSHGRVAGEKLAREAPDQPADEPLEHLAVERRDAAADAVGGVEVLDRRGVVPQVVEPFAGSEVEHHPVALGDVAPFEPGQDPRDPRSLRLGEPPRRDQPVVGGGLPGRERERPLEVRRCVLEAPRLDEDVTQHQVGFGAGGVARDEVP